MARFIFFLIFLALVFAAGVLVGDRHGAPAWARAATEPLFERFGQPLQDPDAPTGAPAGETDDASDAAASSAAVRPSSAASEPSSVAGNAALRINAAALQIIKDSEGLRLEMYEAGGNTFIGYGHLRKPGDPTRVTEAQAEEILRQDVKIAEDGVRSRLTQLANSNEFSAMVSLAYNIGTGNFGRSPVLAAFNRGDKSAAAAAFMTHNRAGGRVLDKLTARRAKERALFETPVA
ncbi:MAG: lysozyme [Pseudomonadota bacterium]